MQPESVSENRNRLQLKLLAQTELNKQKIKQEKKYQYFML